MTASASWPTVDGPLSIASPDGKTVEIDWEIFESCTNPDLIDENNPPVCSHWARIGSVSNSVGYRIAFAYASNGNSGTNQAPPPDSWQRRERADLFNDLVSTSVAQASVAYSYPSAKRRRGDRHGRAAISSRARPATGAAP